MYHKISDAHIHLDLYKKSEQDLILKELEIYNVQNIISVSEDLHSAQANLALANKYEEVKVAFGFHPEQALPNQEELSALLQFIEINQTEMVAIGEVGLPYYLEQEDDKLLLKGYIELLTVFIKQAVHYNKPIILHAVYEHAPIVIKLLEKYNIQKAHFHWFKGDSKTIQHMIRNGYMVSITPDVLYEQEIESLVEQYPLSLMMVETDGPWAFEEQFKGQLTHPKMIHESIKRISEIKQENIFDVYDVLLNNTEQFYLLRK